MKIEGYDCFVGVTGSREGFTYPQRIRFLSCLEDIIDTMGDRIMLLHGGCVGVDRAAHAMFTSRVSNGSVQIHPGPKGKWSGEFDAAHNVSVLRERPFLDRNKTIVDGCDLLIGIPSVSEPERYPNGAAKGGTWSTIEYAMSRYVPCLTLLPDGSAEKNYVTRWVVERDMTQNELF